MHRPFHHTRRHPSVVKRKFIALAAATTLTVGGGAIVAAPAASAAPATPAALAAAAAAGDPLLGTCLQLDDDHVGLLLAEGDITDALTELLSGLDGILGILELLGLGSVLDLVNELTGVNIHLSGPDGEFEVVNADLENGVIQAAELAVIELPDGVTDLTYTIVPSGLTGLLGTLLGPLLGVSSGNVSGTANCGSVLPLEGLNGSFHPVAPARALDTRKADGPTEGIAVGPRETVSVKVLGEHGVPTSGVSAVNLNVTATEGTSGGFVRVFPTGTAAPDASNLNYGPGQNIANAAFAAVGTGGEVSFYNGSNGTVHLLADVSGYFVATNPILGLTLLPGGYQPVDSTRLFDSRHDGPGPLGQTDTRDVQVAGVAGVPANAGSVVVNLTAVNTHSRKAGLLSVYPTGIEKPYVSNLNFTPGKTVGNQVVVPVGADGKIRVYHGSADPAATADVIVDIVGYFQSGLLPASTSGLQKGTEPARILDSRHANGIPTTVKIGGKQTVTLQVSGRGGIPSSFVRGVLLTVTATQEQGGGFVTIYPSGVNKPTVSTLNFGRRDIANQALVAVGTDGTIKLYNGSPLPTHLVVDVTGYIVGSTVELG